MSHFSFDNPHLTLAPSLLAADFACLDSQLKTLSENNMKWLHVDVMDGHFVPNLSFGPPVISHLKDKGFFLDVHLMVEGRALDIPAYHKAGADAITIHLEACQNPMHYLQEIRDLGLRAGISLKPETPFDAVLPFLAHIDLLLIMTVSPGFGGQEFRETCLDKIEEAARMQKDEKNKFLISVDGGITPQTASLCKRAGAQVFVAGTSIFKGQIAQNLQTFEEVLHG